MEDQESENGSRGWLLFLTTALLGPCLLLSRLASGSFINRTTVGDNTVVKQRKWFANFLRIPGNVILRFRRAPVRVLSRKRWHQRESEFNGATFSGNGLSLERLGGEPLSEYLANTDSGEDRMAAITTAMRALFDFHLQHDQSHGDASASNVMIRELPDATLLATWFDFDVAHFDSTPMLIRRADDLRALLFTSQQWLTKVQFASLFQGWDIFYPDENVWAEFQSTMSNPLCHCDVFHLAQIRRAKSGSPFQAQRSS